MNIAVIFAGGVGSRMNSAGLPKQFLEVNGVPIIIHTLRVFQQSPLIDRIVVACKADYIDYLRDKLALFRLDKVGSVVPGGETGQESIYRGLLAAHEEAGGEEATVLIHDGVRPLIDLDLIRRNLESVSRFGNAVSCAPSKETVVLSGEEGTVAQVLPRDRSLFARAPQSFRLSDILAAHEKARAEGLSFVDSCSMMLHYGHKIHTVETASQNIKITTPDDFYVFKALLSARENAQILGVEG